MRIISTFPSLYNKRRIKRWKRKEILYEEVDKKYDGASQWSQLK